MAKAVVHNFGLVCITLSPRYRFRSITRTRLLTLGKAEQSRTLAELYWDNLLRLHAMLGFCDRSGIRLYRMTSALFPMSDMPVGAKVLESLASNLGSVGRRARQLGIRMLVHPDQFVVLNSPSAAVRKNSRIILDKHARVLDLLGLERSQWAPIILHGGDSGARTSKAKATDLLCTVIDALPEASRSRLCLENDEYAFSADEIHAICRRTGVAMIFDNLHHAVHEKIADYADPSFARCVHAARTTWTRPDWQIVHLSNGDTSPLDRCHSEFITDIPPAYRDVKWIEIEARGKDDAIHKLREQWQNAPAASIKSAARTLIAGPMTNKRTKAS